MRWYRNMKQPERYYLVQLIFSVALFSVSVLYACHEKGILLEDVPLESNNMDEALGYASIIFLGLSVTFTALTSFMVSLRWYSGRLWAHAGACALITGYGTLASVRASFPTHHLIGMIVALALIVYLYPYYSRANPVKIVLMMIFQIILMQIPLVAAFVL